MNKLGHLRKKSRVIVIRADAGEGKTTLATHFAYQSYRAEGTHIFANYHLNEEYIDNFTYMTGEEILSRPEYMKDGILIVDEISKIASARKFATKVNQEFLELISERRKLKLDIIVIGQTSKMFDSQLRGQATHLIAVKQNPDNESEFAYVVQDLRDMDYMTQAPRVVNEGVFDARYMWDIELFDTEETVDKVYKDKEDKNKEEEEEIEVVEKPKIKPLKKNIKKKKEEEIV